MPKPPSDSLHRLIHSLSPIEKRNMTNSLKSSDGGKDLHLKLFQDINKMKVYDAAAEIKLRGKDSTFAARKNYLFKAILRRIDQIEEAESNHNRIERYVRYGQILAERSLLKEAMKNIDKAEKIAVESELFGHLTLIYDIKKRTYQSLLPFSEYQKKLNKIFIQRAELSQSLHNYEQLKIAHSNYKLILTKHGSVNLPKRDQEKLKKIRESELFSNPKFPKTNHARILYHDIRAIHAVFFHTDYETGYKEYKKVNKCIENIPNYLEQNVYDYLFYVSKVVYYGLHINKYPEVEHIHNGIRKIHENGTYENFPFLDSHVSQYFIHLEIVTIFKYGNFHKIETLDPLITDDFIRFEGMFQEETVIVTSSNVGMTWLANGNPKKAISWFLRLVNNNYTVRQDILNSTCVHLLMAIIDIDDIDLFDRYYRSFQRKSQFLPVEEWLMKKLNNIQSHTKDRDSLNDIFTDTLDGLKKKITADTKLNNFNMLLVLYWLKSKLDGKDLSTTLKNHNEKEILN